MEITPRLTDEEARKEAAVLEVGHAALKSLANTNWIKRRVEAIELQSNGENRRKISFDFYIPWQLLDSLDVHRSLTKPSLSHHVTEPKRHASGYQGPECKQTAVPLCFMQKTTIVNLDLVNFRGDSIPVATIREHNCLVMHAFNYLIHDIEHRARKLFDEPELDPSWYQTTEAIVKSSEIETQSQRNVLKSDQEREEYIRSCRKQVMLGNLNLGQFSRNIKRVRPDSEHPLETLVRQVVALTSEAQTLQGSLMEKDGSELASQLYLFLALLETVARHFVFVAVVEKEDLNRRMLAKVSYGAQLNSVRN